MTAAWPERLTDWVGPIVVKEVRQGLRARTFAVFFGLLLAAAFTTALVAWAGMREGQVAGKSFLAAYLIGLGAIGYFVIPYTAFRSLVREREEETWVLLVLTGLGARQVVRGKFLSAMTQSMLYASAVAPFVLFSYYLNGVTVVQVVVGLVLVFAWNFFLVALGLGLASQPLSRAGRTGSHLAVVLLLGAASMMAFGFTGVLAFEGSKLLSQPAFINGCLVIAYAALGGGLVVLEGAAAGMALEAEAVSGRPRLALTMFIVGSWALGCAGCVIASADREGLMLASVGTSLVLVVAGFFAVSERDGFLPTCRLEGLARPGALRSFWLVIGLLAASTVVWIVLFSNASSPSGSSAERRLAALVAAPAYVALYLSLAVLAGRWTPLGRLGEPGATRAGFIACCVVGMVGPPLAALGVGERADNRALNVLNPFFGLVNFVDRYRGSLTDEGFVVLAFTTVVAVVLAGTALAARDGARHA